MPENKSCQNCLKQFENHYNDDYCSWSCRVEFFVKNGAKVVAPNNLPARSIKYKGSVADPSTHSFSDYVLYECEHGDHPTYKFPVIPEFRGVKTDKDEGMYEEMHALIYDDGYIALTLYECTYHTWLLSRNGQHHGGNFYNKDWYLTEESLNKIREKSIRNHEE